MIAPDKIKVGLRFTHKRGECVYVVETMDTGDRCYPIGIRKVCMGEEREREARLFCANNRHPAPDAYIAQELARLTHQELAWFRLDDVVEVTDGGAS